MAEWQEIQNEKSFYFTQWVTFSILENLGGLPKTDERIKKGFTSFAKPHFVTNMANTYGNKNIGGYLDKYSGIANKYDHEGLIDTLLELVALKWNVQKAASFSGR